MLKLLLGCSIYPCILDCLIKIARIFYELEHSIYISMQLFGIVKAIVSYCWNAEAQYNLKHLQQLRRRKKTCSSRKLHQVFTM